MGKSITQQEVEKAEAEHEAGKKEAERKPLVIREKSGRELFVSDGDSEGKRWGTYYRIDDGTTVRMKSKYRADCYTLSVAEADLFEYAKKNDCIIVSGGADLLKEKMAEPKPQEPEPGTPQAEETTDAERCGDRIESLTQAAEIMRQMTATPGWRKLYAFMRDQVKKHTEDLKTEDKSAELHRLQARIAVLESLMAFPCTPVTEFNEFVEVKMPLYTEDVTRRARWDAAEGVVDWSEKE